MLDLLDQLEACLIEQRQAVLATIIEKEGSTYRGVGAKSLFFSSGQFIGILSGGCVEQDMAEHAKRVLETGKSTVLHYDLRADDDTPWGLGVSCNGALDILLQPIDPIHRLEQAEKICSAFRKRLFYSTPFTVITVLSSDDDSLDGEVFIWEEDEDVLQEKFGDFCNRIHKEIHIQQQDKDLKLTRGSSILQHSLKTKNNTTVQVNLLIETYSPIPKLVIFGAGPDAIPVVKASKLLHWHVTVVDHRPHYANKSCFPDADQIVLVSPGKFPEQIMLDQGTYTVVMSHHFQQDAIYLEHLVDKHIPYLGILGPRQRTVRLLNELSARKITITKEFLERIYSPIGLDIGAETAEEIALSIVSEMVCRYHQKNSLSLRAKKGPIQLSDTKTASLSAVKTISIEAPQPI